MMASTCQPFADSQVKPGHHPLSPAERTAQLLAPKKLSSWHKEFKSSPSRLHRATGAMRTA